MKSLIAFLLEIRFWPVLLVYIIKIFQKDKEAMLFKEDIAYWPKMSLIEIVHKRPYYKMVLYRRLGRMGSVLKRICGTYPVFINNPSNMRLGGE